jgi:hypothetical protein
MSTPSPQDRKWMLFLSHAHEDQQFVDWLNEKLRAMNLTVWYDKFEILEGDAILEKMDEGLRGSEFLIVVVSEASLRSRWVKAELEPKILQQIEGGQVTVLPLALGDVKTEDISIFLKGRKWIRFPQEGSDEQIEVLRKGIEGQLKRRGML